MTDQHQTTGSGTTDRAGSDPYLGAGNGPPPSRPAPDTSALIALLDALRRLIPAELQEQWTALQREFLLTLRALIDWYLERLESPHQPEVEDIPIE